jgi:hypothetical protein
MLDYSSRTTTSSQECRLLLLVVRREGEKEVRELESSSALVGQKQTMSHSLSRAAEQSEMQSKLNALVGKEFASGW